MTHTLPGDDPAMDYAALRQEGLRQLERLAGSGWTDFNEHDPGITILEQFCYALTELAYRCGFPLPDLLSREGKAPYASLPGPARILASRPVTLADLRKLAVDVRGVRNAWIEKVGQPAPPFFHDGEGVSALQDRQEKLIQLNGGEGLAPVALKGLYRVLIESSEVLGVESAELVRNVARRLHAHRPLCMDFESVRVMDRQNIQVRASIEIDTVGNPEDIHVAILGKIAAHISPSVPFHTLAQRLAAGLRVDEVFDGPPLDQGFIDTAELSRMERKTALRASDFVRAIMEVEGVLMVKYLALSGDSGTQWQDWWLDLAEGVAPVLDVENSVLSLERRQIPVGVDIKRAVERHRQARASQAYRPAKPEELDILPPAGRDRRVGRYYSAQHQFPEVYGLGGAGLPPQADGRRRAQLNQLKAYLLFFDQLLANQFAQLAHVGDLLGFDDDNPQTYFAADIDDPALGLEAVWRRKDAKARRERLGQIVENPATADGDPDPQTDWTRKNRFLDHLLARFAEQFTDHAQFRQDWAGTPSQRQERLARGKQAWLRGYPQLSAGRGTGFDCLLPWNATAGPGRDNGSGLEQRLRLKLGLGQERFYLVEHVLLRPLDADKGQAAPLLADARCADPYSLQISLVFPNMPDCVQEGGGYRRYVEQTLREEVPVHLLVYLRWLDEPGMAAFADAYQTWLDSQRALREGSDQKTLGLALDNEERVRLGFRLRDARDRLVDLLAIGHTYPLADLRVSYTEKVAWGQPGKITLLSSQTGVLYQLFERQQSPGKGGKALAEATGDGGDLDLEPTITQDTGFVVKAIKPHSSLSAAVLGTDGKIHLEGSRLDTRYELCGQDGSPLKPRTQAVGNGGELILTPPSDAADGRYTVRAVKTLAVTLLQSIDIKVGLDTGLQATILDADLLDPSSTRPGLDAPRIVAYGATPRVEIQASQAGVDYRLVRIQDGPAGADHTLEDPVTKASIALKTLSKNAVRGDSHAITLQTLPMEEDTDIRILAIKTFDASENQDTQTDLLKTTLPLNVRPNPALAVAVKRSMLDYRTGTEVVVKGSQASARYQIAARPILDGEFVRDGSDPAAFKIDGMAALWLRNPPNPTPDMGFFGETKPGNGADLALPIDGLTEDSLVVVRATKTHQSTAIPPSVQLSQGAAILVRPDPAVSLRFKAKDDGTAAAGLRKDAVYAVLNGQPGVFYHFRLAGKEEDLGMPVYFHKVGKGIGQLQVEIDFTLAGSLPTPPPEWDCPVDLDPAALLSIRAVKAQTGLEAVFERSVAALLAAD